MYIERTKLCNNCELGKGAKNKNCKKFGLCLQKKLTSIFVQIASLLAETNFTFGNNSKENKFPL